MLATMFATGLGVGLGAGCSPGSGPDMGGVPGPGGKADDALEGACEASCDAFLACVGEGEGARACGQTHACAEGVTPCETQAQLDARKAAVDERRARPRIMLHRGSWAFAHENTMEAYRATFELGADGNEIDVRRTSDGALVMFHDDFLDARAKAYGDLAELDLDGVHDLHLRDPGPLGELTRIPSFAEALDLHRRYAGLVHLDLKAAGADDEVVALLDVLDMWSHVTEVNENGGNAAAVRNRPEHAQFALGGMIGLTDARGDFDPGRIEDAVDRLGPQGGLFVDDPRLALVALGRVVGEVSEDPWRFEPWDPSPFAERDPSELLEILDDADDWDEIPMDAAAAAGKAERIRARFEAALAVAEQGLRTPELFAALEDRALHRSLHADWRHHGVDGAEAVTSVLRLGDPAGCGTPPALLCAAELARAVLESEGTDLAPLDAVSEFPASDWRIKGAAIRALPQLGDAGALQLALDVLAWTADDHERRGPVTLEEVADAAVAMLPGAAGSEEEATALAIELLQDDRKDVSGRAAWALWARADEPWAHAAITAAAPHALD